ncbi:MAG: hypothetical protein WBA10_13540, partial [Elainellaceae cyanobacterium]
FDLYRLTAEQVPALAPDSYWDGGESPLGIVLIEWCDRLPYRPEAALNISLEAIAPGDASLEAAENDLGRVATLTLTGRSDISLEAIAVGVEAHP